MNAWRRVSDDTWSACVAAATQREQAKRRLASTRAWRGGSSTHLPGLIGETLVARLAGLEPNLDLHAGGDDGTDLPATDVKTTTHATGGLACPADRPLRAAYYCLVVVDLERRRARYAGWASRRDLLNASLRTLRREAGPQRYIAQDELHPGLPPSLQSTPLRLA